MPLYLFRVKKYQLAGSTWSHQDGREETWSYDGSVTEVFEVNDDDQARERAERIRKEKVHAFRIEGGLYRCEKIG